MIEFQGPLPNLPGTRSRKLNRKNGFHYTRFALRVPRDAIWTLQFTVRISKTNEQCIINIKKQCSVALYGYYYTVNHCWRWVTTTTHLVFRALQKLNLTLKITKYSFFQTSIDYLRQCRTANEIFTKRRQMVLEQEATTSFWWCEKILISWPVLSIFDPTELHTDVPLLQQSYFNHIMVRKKLRHILANKLL